MSTKRAAYFKGVRLWEWLQEYEPWAQRTTSGTVEGVKQTHLYRNADSPNFDRSDFRVETVVEYMEAHSDLATLTTMEHALLDTEIDLIANATSEGYLSICDDPGRKVTVTGGTLTGDDAVVQHSAPAGGWTRTAGRYVLCRLPSSGVGFVTDIDAVDSGGANRLTLDIASGVTMTTSWEIVDVQTCWQYATFLRMHGGSARQSGPDSVMGAQWRRDVTYYFAVRGGTLINASHLPSHDNG
jgi:hypothetical protein